MANGTPEKAGVLQSEPDRRARFYATTVAGRRLEARRAEWNRLSSIRRALVAGAVDEVTP